MSPLPMNLHEERNAKHTRKSKRAKVKKLQKRDSKPRSMHFQPSDLMKTYTLQHRARQPEPISTMAHEERGLGQAICALGNWSVLLMCLRTEI